MGTGYNYKCGKCEHAYLIYPGPGMNFPKQYKNMTSNISEGKYGRELQEVFNSTQYAAVDAENVVYVCKECGSWKEDKDVSLYVPNDPDSIAQKKYGRITVAELGFVPYVTRAELDREYHIVKRYYYRCGRCGKRMHKASDDELLNLQCPKCGSANKAKFAFRWD